ncbi:MAG TPA: hypothetical protein VJN70_18985 [Gemmatimonadaceae bacterium]|nr:hypothetical protein [Gemmatimonadaceae bacterium]
MPEKSRSRAATTASGNDGAAAPIQMEDRRKRVALRRLIDEMLTEIRAAAREENWTPEARTQAESDLARIMDQVRREAMRAEPKPKAKRAKPR